MKELELPEFDEEFVQTLGNYDSTDAFRASVEEQLRKDHQEKYDDEYFNGLLDDIAKQTKMIYPPQMLEHEQEHVLEDIKSRLAKQNLNSKPTSSFARWTMVNSWKKRSCLLRRNGWNALCW